MDISGILINIHFSKTERRLRQINPIGQFRNTFHFGTAAKAQFVYENLNQITI